ncbi:hypothetical protein [Streptomyces xanthochromogenes]|uniref:hypothetical protein n=1 Tax=Streptomyces xanthochromogenes TaxID=67384 RepID=UPI003435DF90
MRIRPALALLLAAAALSGCGSTSDNSPTSSTTSREWEPDDALQRADRALDTDDTALTVIDRNAPHVASGMNKTFDTPGSKPYRLDITCDSYEVTHLTLVLIRGQTKHTQDLPCGAREAQRLNIPTGPPFTAAIAPAKAGTTGLIAWRLNTLDPHEAEGCTNIFAPCASQPTTANSP